MFIPLQVPTSGSNVAATELHNGHDDPPGSPSGLVRLPLVTISLKS